MTLQLRILQLFFKATSFISPRLSGIQAFKVFQKVRKKSVRKREEPFYSTAKHFKLPSVQEDVNCYELGKVDGDLIFLVHGWESNAGSMSRFAFELAAIGYRVVSFDLPGHATTKSKHTNLYECKEAFKSVLNFIDPQKPFTVISHSFGSAVTTYTLSSLNYEVDKFVFLTSPNSLFEVLDNFKKLIGLNEKSFSYVLGKTKALLNEDVRQVNVDEKLQKVSFSKLLLVHDKFDKIIPFRNSEKINETNRSNSELKTYRKIGHYRMLWDDTVVNDTMSFITT